MKNNLFSPPSQDDDISDSLSTTNSFSHLSAEANSLFHQLSDTNDSDILSSQTKKIRKKRNAYGKIDDEKRIQLLDAVQNRGETLKAASKRLGINYSSAKSIIHTYRKEGRILKKSVCSIPLNTMEMSPFETTPFKIENLHHAKIFNFPSTLNSLDIQQVSTGVSSLSENSPSSPMRGLSGALGYLGLNNYMKMEEPSQTQVSSIENHAGPRVPLQDLSIYYQANTMANKGDTVLPKIQLGEEKMEQAPMAHSNELFKHLDNFYMNYSDSPLSGGKGNMYNDDSCTRRGNPKEFNSFSELVNSFGNPSCLSSLGRFQYEGIGPINGWSK